MLTPLAAYRAELAKRVAVHAPTTLDDTLAEFDRIVTLTRTDVCRHLEAELERDQARPPGERMKRGQRDGYLVAVAVVDDYRVIR